MIASASHFFQSQVILLFQFSVLTPFIIGGKEKTIKAYWKKLKKKNENKTQHEKKQDKRLATYVY